ncbi:GIY-YIG nuclease family protein [Halalkalibacillus halophilus]|uniref:GIY-YIG nuclease family protein n=1 Tax=Halalkalibacillus halophilus TaxID=392827 RepID=UPI0003FD7D1E|nr:GIY-YIG nuclease family protein [Halalkalibacillus halophilus]
MFYIYILRCKDNSLYTGYTNDVKSRFNKHQLGKASKYTRAKLPVELVYVEIFETKSEAMKREVEIKKFAKGEKESLIQLSSQFVHTYLE